jgi:hypothetical protein
MATPEELNEVLTKLKEGLLQLSEAVKTAADSETDAERIAREDREKQKRADEKAQASEEYLQNRRRVAEEAAINQELGRLGRRITIDGRTEKLEDSHIDVLAKVNKALTESAGVFSGLTGTALEAMKAQVKQQALVDNHLEQVNRQIENSIAYTEAQANQIRMADMALKEKQREVEASKNLGNVGLKQLDLYQDTIGKLKNQLDSTVKLTDQQYKEINAVEQSIRVRNKEIDSIKNAGKNLADMVGRVKDFSSALQVLKEKQLAEAEGDATKTAGIIAKFALFNIGLGLATNAFDLLVAGIKGYYEGILATQRALYAGERGEKVAQASAIAMYKALGAQAKSSGDSLINLGKEAAAAGIAISVMIPGSALFKVGIAAAGLAVGGLTMAMGAAEKVAGELAERQAEVLEMYAEQMDALFNGFSELGKASMIGAKGMDGLYENLHKVGFTVKEFDKLNKVLQTNAKDMKMFGATASEGVDKFVEVSSGLVYSELGHTLRLMGISTEEMLDHQAKYMAQQARFGMLQNKTTEQLIKGTSDYIIELDKTAALTGASRKDQEDAMKFVMANEKLRAGMLVEEEKAKKTGDYTVLNQMEQASKLAAKLYESGQKRAATGAAEYYGGGKAVTSAESAEFYSTFTKTIKDLNKGKSSDTALFMQSNKEAYKAALRVAGSRRYGGNTEGLLGDSTASIVDAKKRTDVIEAEASKRGIKEGTPEYEKLIAELGKTRVATDGLTKEQVALREQNRDKAIVQDNAVRNKDLSALLGSSLGPPANTMMNAGNTMLEAAKKMWESIFGKSAEPAPKSDSVVKAEAKATESRKSSDDATQSLMLVEDKKKAAEEELKMMRKRMASQAELDKQEKKILEIEKERTEAIKKDNALSQQKMQDALTAKNERLRQRKLENSLEPLEKEAKSLQEKLNKYNAEKIEIEKEGKARPGTARDQKDRKLALEGVSEDIAKLQKELDEKLKQVSGVKTEIGNISAKASAPSASSKTSAPGGASMLSGGSTLSTSNSQLRDAGLRIKPGDVQAPGSKIDPKLLDIAKQVQESVPGFNYFSGFNDVFHQEQAPGSKHTQGLAFDFTVNPGRGKSKPSKEDSDQIIKMLKGLGINTVINEYDNPSAKATGGHFHAELSMPKAYDGGLFDGPKAGYPVELHGREAIVPLPDPSSKISVETPATSDKTPLNSVLANNTNNANETVNMSSQILQDLYILMEEKFDTMISALSDGNDISDKLLKHSRV